MPRYSNKMCYRCDTLLSQSAREIFFKFVMKHRIQMGFWCIKNSKAWKENPGASSVPMHFILNSNSSWQQWQSTSRNLILSCCCKHHESIDNNLLWPRSLSSESKRRDAFEWACFTVKTMDWRTVTYNQIILWELKAFCKSWTSCFSNNIASVRYLLFQTQILLFLTLYFCFFPLSIVSNHINIIFECENITITLKMLRLDTNLRTPLHTQYNFHQFYFSDITEMQSVSL